MIIYIVQFQVDQQDIERCWYEVDIDKILLFNKLWVDQ